MNVKKYFKNLVFVLLFFGMVFTFIFFLNCYPVKYKNIINKISEKYEIQKELICAIINVESSFNKDVISAKGAVGLMQILPSTAQWVAGMENIEYSYDMLFNVEYNIKIGTKYVKYLLNKFNCLETAIVAYNAGEGNVLNWLNNKEYSEDKKKLHKIPYKESANYLKRVKQSIKIYKILI